MITLNVVTRDGGERLVVAEEGLSAMEAIRASGIDEVQALCGGCCSCATCHVYVDEADLARLPDRSSDEDDLLDSLPERTTASRLSCQISCSKAIDGIRLTIGPE